MAQKIDDITNDYLSRHLSALGYPIWRETSGWWTTGDPAEINAIIASYDPKPDALAAKLAALAAYRWEREQAGSLAIAGVEISTDDRAKIMLAGKCQWAQRYPDQVFNWKIKNGEAIPLTSAQVIAIGDAMVDRVQGYFDREAEIASQLAAMTWQEIDAFDIVANW